jgi:2-alkyl-3-oxoalkanoate reductase
VRRCAEGDAVRIFVAGATGAIGRRLIPMLIDAGHHVVAMTRSESKTAAIEAQGAVPVVCDVFDAGAIHRAVAQAYPDALIHELTDLPPALDPDPARFDEQFGGNIRIRIEGTRKLVDAASAAGVGRIVAQSIAFVYLPVGGPVKSEGDPLWDNAPEPFRRSVEAVRSLETVVTNEQGIDGVVLRYGYFYGPGTFYASDGSITEQVRRGDLPIVGDGDDVSSFIHVDDAAAATVLALTGPPGIYNVVDDEPAPLREWLPVLAAAAGGPEPAYVDGEPTAGSFERGASNAKAKRELGWTLRHPSWRGGFGISLG